MKNRWAYPLYNLLLILALPLIALVILVRWRRRVLAQGGDRWEERWGRLTPAQIVAFDGGWWWVHAVSVGEVKAIEPFLRQIPKAADVRVLLSAVTPEAIAWATDHKLADQVIAAPLDLPWIVRRVFAQVRPKLFVSVESEFWPNLLREAKRAGAQVALINGRISERSFKSYRRIQPILSVLWEKIDLFSVRQAEDAGRFTALGVPAGKIQITGNMKYDLYTERRNLKRSGTPVVVMGSTREGEESRLLPAMERVRAQVPQMRVIWAPRHIERMHELESLLTANGLAYQKISDMRKEPPGGPLGPSHVLWDSMGDLLDAYRQADVAIVGGSFVPKGGQNPIEPAALRLPVLFGPSMDNFQGIAESLVRAGGARRVSVDNLDGHLSSLLQDSTARQEMGERAHGAVVAEQGATERTLTLLKELVRA